MRTKKIPLIITVIFLLLLSSTSSAHSYPCVNDQLGTVVIGQPFTSQVLNNTVQSSDFHAWIFGKNLVLFNDSLIRKNGSAEFTIPSGITRNLTEGKYYVIIQSRGNDDAFDIILDRSTNAVINQKDRSGKQFLFSMDPAYISSHPYRTYLLFVNATCLPGIDDTFRIYSMTVVKSPSTGPISLDPVHDHIVNEPFTITGTTTIPAGTELLVEIYSPDHMLGPKGTSYSGSAGKVTIKEGSDGKNIWSYPVNPSDLQPDEYRVVVSSYQTDAQVDALFTIYGKPSDTTNCSSSDIPPKRAEANPTHQSASLVGTCGIIVPVLCVLLYVHRQRSYIDR